MTHARKTKDFSYEGKGQKGQKVTGIITATNLTVAKIMLKRQNVTVTKIKPVGTMRAVKKTTGRAKSEDVTLFVRQLATMLTAGIPLVQSLQAIIEGTEKEKMKATLKTTKEDVEAGISFSEALRKHPREFDELICNLVEAGELSGTLDSMLARIAVYKERSEYLKKKIKKAMYYPITILIIAGIVTTILLVKVVPTFKDMFSGFGAQLPAFTLLVLGMSETLQEYGLRLLIALGACTYLLIYSYKTKPNIRQFIQRIFLKMPITGSILRKAIIARFARTLSTTFAAGVPLTDALTSVAKSSGNIIFFNAIIQIKENVSAGQQIKEAIQHSGIFPNMVVQMIAIGEESGTLEEMLTKIAVIFEQEVDTSVDGLTTLLEPIIMVILGVLVGGLVIAMYLPIFKLGSVL